jgi:hypothetical protein
MFETTEPAASPQKWHPMKQAPDEHGSRSFAALLTQIDDGSLHAELSEELRRVARELSERKQSREPAETVRQCFRMVRARITERHHPLDSHTLIRLAAESARDPRTVRSVAKGGGSPLARAAVIAAAQRLGIDLYDPANNGPSIPPPRQERS